MKRIALVAALLAGPVFADVDSAVTAHILPVLDGFAEAASALDSAAHDDCTADALTPAYHAVFDAWMQIADIRIGPSEPGALTISFWPDKKGRIPKSLAEMIARSDPNVAEPGFLADASIAVRGLFALEFMLFDPDQNTYGPGSFSCTLVQAQTRDLAHQATALRAAWDAFLPTILEPGTAGNTTYLDETEAQRALYTQILASLELTADQRLGRPMGDPTRARPTRAEAWRSGRSLVNVVIATESAVALAHHLADWDLPETDAALRDVQKAAARIDDPSFQDITNLSKRLKLEVLAQAVEAVETAIETEVGTRFGLTPGFNSSDGD